MSKVFHSKHCWTLHIQASESVHVKVLKVKTLTENFKEMFRKPTMVNNNLISYFEPWLVYNLSYFFLFLDSERLLLRLVIIGWSSSAISRPFCLFLCLYHVQVSFCIIWPLLSAGMNRWHCNPSFFYMVKTAFYRKCGSSRYIIKLVDCCDRSIDWHMVDVSAKYRSSIE